MLWEEDQLGEVDTLGDQEKRQQQYAKEQPTGERGEQQEEYHWIRTALAQRELGLA